MSRFMVARLRRYIELLRLPMPVMMIHVPILVVIVSVIVGHGEPEDHFHAEWVSLEVRIVMIIGFWLVRRMVGRLWAVFGVEAKDVLKGAAVNGHGIPNGLLVRRIHVHHVHWHVHVVVRSMSMSMSMA